MTFVSEIKWLLLIHQIPPKPAYFRAKILRRLQQIGAVPIKQSVYVLPQSDQTYEDMLWIFKEIISSGGEATISETSFLEGLSDEQIRAMFQAARNADYQRIAKEVRDLTESLNPKDGDRGLPAKQLHKLKKQFHHIVSIDFFTSPAAETARTVIANAESLLNKPPPGSRTGSSQNFKGRTWITRKGIYVDRISSAWLIHRFIDPNARFKFVSGKSYPPKPDEIRFDMSEAEFTHENDRCTFEVLREQCCPENPALVPIAEIIHDIDFKDEKFSRPETPGVKAMLTGVAAIRSDDDARLEHGSIILDGLYEYFLIQNSPENTKGVLRKE
jgi:hypothetical protein